MKDYLLLFRGGHPETLQQSPDAWQAHMQKWMQWMGELGNQGKFVGAQPLATDGKTVAGNKKVVSDGPYAEGKDIISGLFVVTADSYEQAQARLASGPHLEFGWIELREIDVIPQRK